jgi:serpin B
MMHETLYANLGSYNSAASVLAIPYKNSEASMYIFLPPQGGMTALEGVLSGPNINAWLAANSSALTATSAQQVSLALPKFTFKTQYDLTATFQQIGMQLAFTKPGLGSGADFSGIDGNRDLYITDVVHQAYIAVDETGTVAAAATGVVVTKSFGAVIAQPRPIPFTVDHPFIFLIVENTTNTVLFMGRVDDPLATN